MPFRLFAVLLLAAAWLSGIASGRAWAQEPLKIGLSGPFTGGSSSLGAGVRDGAKLAAEEINAAGGVDIGGSKRLIQFIERDDQAKNDVGAKIAQELIAEKVIATVGFVNTGVALASQHFYQEAAIPVISCSVTGTKVAKQFPAPNYIFRNSANDAIQSAMIAEEAVLRHGFKYVAIFADTTNYGELGRVDLEIALSRWDISPVVIEMFKIGERDMIPRLTRAKDAGAEAILTYTAGAPELAAIANGMEKLGWKAPIIGTHTLASQSFTDLAGANSEGAVMPQTFIQVPTTPRRAAFIQAYQKRFNVDRMPAPHVAAQCYDAVYLLAAGIEQAKSTEGPKILAALENLQKKVEGVVTIYDHPFDAEDHEAISANIPVWGIIANRRVAPAHPQDLRNKAVRVKGEH